MQQGRIDEARQWHEKADDWIAENTPEDKDLLAYSLLKLTGSSRRTMNQPPAPKSGINSNQDWHT